MCAKSRDFADESDEHRSDIDMSDAELEALLAGRPPPAAGDGASQELESGTRVRGRVIDVRGGEVLVELDSKTVGAVDEDEFGGEGPPAVGAPLEAVYDRWDAGRDLAVLRVREARREVFWDELRPGALVEGRVTEVNKGGLTLDVRGERAFLPLSQIERGRVEDPQVYVGERLTCEVVSVDARERDLVLSRRRVLEREAEERRTQALARLGEGSVLTGTVTRIQAGLGAFVDIGGFEGLLHESRIRQRRGELGGEDAIHEGQRLEVRITQVDRERERVALDFHRVAGESWGRAVESWSEGDELTGWVTRVDDEGAWVAVEEGVEGVVPRSVLQGLAEPPARGAVLRLRIAAIDRERKRLELRPR